MDFVMNVVRAVLMVGFVAAVILALAALFIVVFSLGTGIDKRINQ